MKFLKELCASTILYAIASVLSIVAFILLLASNGVQGNAIESIGMGITFGIIGLLAAVGSVVVSWKFPKEVWAPIVHLVAVACFGFLFGFIILNRIELIASLFSYDSNNSLGWSAFTLSVVSLILYILSSIIITVGMFLPQNKKATAEIASEA